MLKKIVHRFNDAKILIIGDLMLDEYLWGEARRISPEAPVPVVNVQRRTLSPGGACNTAMNIASLGGSAFLGGIIGADANGHDLKEELQRARVEVSGVLVDAKRPTITKTRVVARNQQIVRVDYEARQTLNTTLEDNLLSWAYSFIPQVSAVLISDYAKGLAAPSLLQKLFRISQEASVPVLVDPKGNCFDKYRGVDWITPNQQEAEQASGIEMFTEEDLLRIGDRLHRMLDGGNLLIKQGARGMTLFSRDGSLLSIPAAARQVFDVTGAGDTVIATLALALAAGATPQDATRLANTAAGIVVGKVGTATVTQNELLSALS